MYIYMSQVVRRTIPKKPINPKTGRYEGQVVRISTKPPAPPVGRTTQTSSRAAAAAVEAAKPAKPPTKRMYRNLPDGYEDSRMESIERARRIDEQELERAREQLKKKETEKQRAAAKATIEKVLLAAALKRRATIARKKLEAEKKAQEKLQRQQELERQRYDENDGVRFDDYDNISSHDMAQLKADQESFLAAHPLIKPLTWCAHDQMKTGNIESKIKESKVRKNQGHERGKCYFLSSRCAQCLARKSSFLSDRQTGGRL